MGGSFETLFLVIIILILIYKYVTRNYNYFKIHNIEHEKPVFLFGNLAGFFLRQETFYDFLKKYHRNFKNAKIYGMYNFRTPFIGIRDPELIKQFAIKDFNHFANHSTIIKEEDDPIFSNNLVNMINEKWKDMRSTLTPVFTANKMKIIFELIKECCEESMDFLKNETRNNNSNDLVLEMKDFFSRVTNDAIATSAFGIKINSLRDKNNDFFKTGKYFSSMSDKWLMFKFVLFTFFGPIMRFFRIKFFDDKKVNYFRNIVLDTMKFREKNNILRPDMINMLMEARKTPSKSHNREWTDDEIIAQCFVFFAAGFENTSNAMAFASHELMENPDIQEKLITEIDEVREQLNGESISYEILKNMKYLDMVVSETLRKYPTLIAADRVCTKPYTLNVDGQKIHFKIGDGIFFNIIGSHYSPDYFQSPEKFYPERFSEENKHNIKPYTYIPFGVGPRNCIADRFALMEIKIILFYLLSEFRIEFSEKSCVPIALTEKFMQLCSKNDFWLKLIPRS